MEDIPAIIPVGSKTANHLTKARQKPLSSSLQINMHSCCRFMTSVDDAGGSNNGEVYTGFELTI